MLPRVVTLPILRPGTCFTSAPPRSVFECAFTRCCAAGRSTALGTGAPVAELSASATAQTSPAVPVFTIAPPAADHITLAWRFV